MKQIKHSGQFDGEATGRTPFSVPGGYFEGFADRIQARVRDAEAEELQPLSLWSRVRPHLAFAAAISGFALISFIVLQLVLGNRNDADQAFDIAILDHAGVLHDESVIMDGYVMDEATNNSSMDQWEEDAMTYLASNEVNIEQLIAEIY